MERVPSARLVLALAEIDEQLVVEDELERPPAVAVALHPVFLTATAVHPTGLLTRHAIAGFRPDVIPAYRRVASPCTR